jgi:cysteinyl-tRNA synthetase
MVRISLHNSLTRRVEIFSPEDPGCVRFYACGPTVYAPPHIGNARAMVIYDQWFRLLRHVYGEASVVYVRNITDVDDKINEAAKAGGVTIRALTDRMMACFEEDAKLLGCLPPTHQPRATEHIGEMVAIIQRLLARDHAYVVADHVYFSVASDPHYGVLSGRLRQAQQAGARVEVEAQKRDPADFVLWKPKDAEDDPSAVFESPWGPGRPGWHIECSAMSWHYLGENFDLHGGGADLMFPHHTNEMAQSCCAFPGSRFASHWIHNGFVTVQGEKMSKSLGNVLTPRDLMAESMPGVAIRLALLSNHYRKPLDWHGRVVQETIARLDYWHAALARAAEDSDGWQAEHDGSIEGFWACLAEDLNTPKALAWLHQRAKDAMIAEDREGRWEAAQGLRAGAKALGLELEDPLAWKARQQAGLSEKERASVEAWLVKRRVAKAARDYAEADRLRACCEALGVEVMDHADGVMTWRAMRRHDGS